MSLTKATPSIVVVGGCIVDLVSYVSRFPKAGETIIGQKFHRAFGGKGANQCVMVANLEEPVAMVAKVGKDGFGEEFIEHFESLSINHDHVTIAEQSHTSTANIAVADSGENTIVNVFGAIDFLSAADVTKASADLFNECKLLICTFECPRETLLEALKAAKAKGVKTLVNAAPCGAEPYEELYPFIDIFCVNEIEAEFACGKRVSNLKEAYAASQCMFQNGTFEILIITLGSNGALVMSRDSENPVHVEAPKVKPIDTTGAGDCLMGSLAYFFVNYSHLPLREQVRRACAVASISVQGEGTQKSFPKKSEIPKELFD